MLSNRLAFTIEFTDDNNSFEDIQLDSPEDEVRFDDKYDLLETLGQGAHAIVKQAIRKDSKQQYAVKIVRSGNQEIQENVRRTFNNTRCLRHPNICQELELYINHHTQTSFLVMEHCSFNSLESIIKNRKLDEQEIKIVAKQLFQAVGHMHNKGICHRDLKPDNILVNLGGDKTPANGDIATLKIVDFGVSRRFISKGQSSSMVTKTGNIYYCAPEIYGKADYTQEVDLWSIGVILFQCATQKLPLHENNEMDYLDLLSNSQKWTFRQELKNLSIDLQNLIVQLLKYDPKSRITIQEALNHPFFMVHHMENMNRSSLSNQQKCLMYQNFPRFIKTISSNQNSDCSDISIDELTQGIGNIFTVQKQDEKYLQEIKLITTYSVYDEIKEVHNSTEEI